jgi:hypothetical protein
MTTLKNVYSDTKNSILSNSTANNIYNDFSNRISSNKDLSNELNKISSNNKVNNLVNSIGNTKISNKKPTPTVSIKPKNSEIVVTPSPSVVRPKPNNFSIGGNIRSIVEQSNTNEENQVFDSKLKDSVAIINTSFQILFMQLYKYITGIEIKYIDVASDAIILSLGNYPLYALSKHSTYLQKDLKEIYYPLTSSLFTTAYGNTIYGTGYLKMLSLLVPFVGLEYLAIDKFSK